jgi:hypothetical protein
LHSNSDRVQSRSRYTQSDSTGPPMTIVALYPRALGLY